MPLTERELFEAWSNTLVNPDALLVNRQKWAELIRSLRGYSSTINRVFDKGHGYTFMDIPIYATLGIEDFQFVQFLPKAENEAQNTRKLFSRQIPPTIP